MGQTEVSAFPLRSSGVLAGHFLLHNNRPPSTHNDNVNILYVPYNNHSESTQQGKAKTMSVSAEALCWWKATQWQFFCVFVLEWIFAAVRLRRAAKSHSHSTAKQADCCCSHIHLNTHWAHVCWPLCTDVIRPQELLVGLIWLKHWQWIENVRTESE